MHFSKALSIGLVLAVSLLMGPRTWAGPLHDAAHAGDLETIQQLLDDGVPVDQVGLASPLYFAAQSGHKEAAELLIKHGADVNNLSTRFGTPLHVAARRDHVQIVEILLQNGADPNIKGGEDQRTPLHFAAVGGSIDVARLLLQQGADVNARTKGFEPAAHLAKLKGHEELAALLVEHGARAVAVKPISNQLASADLEEGRVRAIECAGCHGLEPDKGKGLSGPNLWNLVDRRKASMPDFPYSPAMAAQQGSWNYEELNRFLADTTGAVPGTNMGHGGEPDRSKRIALIAYLRILSDTPVPLP